MTPKEKAMELVNKFWHVEPLESQDGMEIQMAIECALIAIDELINNSIEWLGCKYQDEEIKYWQEVKQEIENYNG